jgi:hypothetical protein
MVAALRRTLSPGRAPEPERSAATSEPAVSAAPPLSPSTPRAAPVRGRAAVDGEDVLPTGKRAAAAAMHATDEVEMSRAQTEQRRAAMDAWRAQPAAAAGGAPLTPEPEQRPAQQLCPSCRRPGGRAWSAAGCECGAQLRRCSGECSWSEFDEGTCRQGCSGTSAQFRAHEDGSPMSEPDDDLAVPSPRLAQPQAPADAEAEDSEVEGLAAARGEDSPSREDESSLHGAEDPFGQSAQVRQGVVRMQDLEEVQAAKRQQ